MKSHILKEFFANYDAYTKDFTRDFATGDMTYHGNSLNIDWRVTVVNTGINTLKGARIKRVEQYLSEKTNKVLISGEHYLNPLVMIKRFVRYYFQFFLLKKTSPDVG